MGLFDDLLKNVDKGLKAVESGALEERLTRVADKLDTASERAEKALAKAADKPAQVLRAVEHKADDTQAKAEEAGS